MTTTAFYAEWDHRASGARRSVRRADLLRRELGLGAGASATTGKDGAPGTPGIPVLTVVGSKGKGTAATYASAYLAASGCQVVTVTSPALRTDRERIRVDGTAISAADLAGLGERLAAAMAALPGPDPDGGYLSPSGLFLLAGVLHARAVGAGALVLEAGMGGRSDEVRLFRPDVVAITEVFAEHVGVLGDTPAEIAADKAGVAAPSTSAVLSLPQTPPVTESIAATVAARTGDRVNVAIVHPHHPASGDAESGPLPGGLGGMNARLGGLAARRLLDVLGRSPASGDRLASVLASVALPGRTSSHPVPGSGTTVLVDAAIDRTGAAAALAAARGRWGRIDHVLACLPDHKDVSGVVAELGDLPVTYVRMPDHPHLHFFRTPPAGRPAVDAADLTVEGLAALGRRIVALGTGYFTGRILDLVGAETEHLFRL